MIANVCRHHLNVMTAPVNVTLSHRRISEPDQDNHHILQIDFNGYNRLFILLQSENWSSLAAITCWQHNGPHSHQSLSKASLSSPQTDSNSFAIQKYKLPTMINALHGIGTQRELT